MKCTNHLQVRKINPYVLLPGDPGRVPLIAKYLTRTRIIAKNREFVLINGAYKSKPVTICSTGIGGPSTAIAVEECIAAGAKVLIRVGTCGGSWRADIPAGSLVIPTACIRDEGTTKEYILPEFPSVADFSVVSALEQSAGDCGVSVRVGINRSHDAFYGSSESIMRWGRYLRDQGWKNFDTPILSSDMETATLFVIGALRCVKTGAVLAVNANPEPLKNRIAGKNCRVVTEANKEITKQTVDRAIRVALSAIKKL